MTATADSDLEGRCFIKRNGALWPADVAADELLAGIKEGREVVMSMRKARNPKHHRWFFAMLRKVVANSDDRWADEYDLLEDLKFATGHAARRENMLTGEQYRVARSINFASMSQEPFKRFVDRCLYVIRRSLGIEPEDLRREIDAEQAPRLPSPNLAPDHPSRERERVE